MARLERDRNRFSLRESFMRRAKHRTRLSGWNARIEQLETRCLLATGPILAGITTNDGNVLAPNVVLNEAPRELTFRFDENQQIDVATLDAIQVIRSNLDDVFGDGDDVVVTPGFVGQGNQTNDVVFRFSETLPDDIFRIEIDGSTAAALRNIGGDPFNNGSDFALEFELDLGPQIRRAAARGAALAPSRTPPSPPPAPLARIVCPPQGEEAACSGGPALATALANSGCKP